MIKKGFTLIETLVVIALLAGLSVTIGLSFSNMMDKQRENEKIDYEKTIEDAACMYAEKNNINGEYGVKVKTLIEEGLLNKNLINPKTKESVINYQENCIAIKYDKNERTCKYTLDKCSEYILPHVNNAEFSVTTDSLTVKIIADAGTNKIKKYYFSKDNGITYEESTSDTYVFENLVENTSYSIKVKVSDTLKNESNIYSVDGKTEEMQKYWEYIEDGTFTVPKSGKYKIEMHGGGGGGGGGAKVWDSDWRRYYKASGGDGGGSGESYIQALNRGESYNIVIGKGGSGGSSRDASDYNAGATAEGETGTDGGSTKFGNLLNVVGGNGGNGGYARSTLSGGYANDGSNGSASGSLANKTSGGSSKGNYGDAGYGGSSSSSGRDGASGAVFITYLGEN